MAEKWNGWLSTMMASSHERLLTAPGSLAMKPTILTTGTVASPFETESLVNMYCYTCRAMM